jgi:hypothetical protein
MKLLYIHGPPAAGKLTIAKAVVDLTHGRLFDNHAAVDFARTVFDFDAPGFWGLVYSARTIALEKAAKHHVPLVVQTACYADPEDLPRLEDCERILARHGGTLLPVFLSCSRRTLEERVEAADRVQRRKLSTREGLDRFLARWNMVPVPRPNCYTVDTDIASPFEAARDIVAHFALGT